jgi:type II secretory ATPase GspE/PulE/Tfp pilus assembly ATPase PilB-like protein
MRLAFVPTKRGEKAALRLADAGRVALHLENLGMTDDELTVIRRVARRPFGMILATGPVGSGKTTTLYSCLNEVDRTRHHVVSIEDPVEVQLDGANQVEVNYALNFGFAQGLRSLLRQDPDVVLVGEIRDEETAEIGVRASMTGRLVFSTLHANQAVGAITTLRNFGIMPFLIANSLQGVIAQRLVRRICEYCSVPVELSADDRQRLQLEDGEPATVSRGEGCDACFHTGYSGRIGVFEILDVDDAIRDMVNEEASERMIRSYAREKGMQSLQKAGITAALAGRTTLEELQRVLGI